MFGVKKYRWFKIATTLNSLSWQNDLCIVEVDEKAVTLAKWDEKIYACAHKCPHAGGVLADGLIDASGNIVCRVHHYKFKLTTGFNTSGEGYYLKTYAVEQREDGLYVGIN